MNTSAAARAHGCAAASRYGLAEQTVRRTGTIATRPRLACKASLPVLLSRGDERRFHDRVARELIARLMWAFLIAAALFLGFTAFDYLLDPARYGRNVGVRLITVALFALLHALSRLPGTARWSREFFLVGVA